MCVRAHRELRASLVQRRHSKAGWNYVHRITKAEKGTRAARSDATRRVAARRSDRRATNAVTKGNPPLARVFAENVWLASLLSFISNSAIEHATRSPKSYQGFDFFLQTISVKKNYPHILLYISEWTLTIVRYIIIISDQLNVLIFLTPNISLFKILRIALI